MAPDLLADKVRISDYGDKPFAILFYDPHDEFELRRHLESLRSELYRQRGRLLKTISLSELMWEVIAQAVPLDYLFETERSHLEDPNGPGLEPTVETIYNIISGNGDEDVSLDRLLRERLMGLDPQNEVAVLTRAGALFPVYRTSALLSRLEGVEVPTILCYPGTLRGAKFLSFMGEYEPDGDYRPRIY